MRWRELSRVLLVIVKRSSYEDACNSVFRDAAGVSTLAVDKLAE